MGAVTVTVIVVVDVAVVVGVFHGVAAARVASVAMETRAGARNIILLVSAAVTGEGAAGCWLLWSLGELTAACAGFIRATGPPRLAASRTF